MSEEKVKQLLAILERLEKAGTLQEFLKEATEVPREELSNSTMIPTVSEGFRKMHDSCMVALSLRLSEMERAMAWVNYYANYCKNIYDGYAANRENIKNPEILNFMKDTTWLRRKNEEVIEGRKKANGVLYLREYGWPYLLWSKHS